MRVMPLRAAPAARHPRPRPDAGGDTRGGAAAVSWHPGRAFL